jgi:hypothetical protein
MASSHPSLRGPHRDKQWTWNMDQTPVYFSYHRNKTLHKRGIWRCLENFFRSPFWPEDTYRQISFDFLIVNLHLWRDL